MNVVAYEESFGEVSFPEGFEITLKGLPIEEQALHYRTTCYSKYSKTGWSERVYEGSAAMLHKDRDVTALIVKDGIVVGIMIRNDYGREVPLLCEESVCTYYSCDNNGAGYKERIDYTWLICIPEDFDKTKNN
ncbi:MAG: hypothetical protein E7647_03625 [Ruminococcaceae bacterium]|nr:hypothetical protein [Oscillospiraceae bacterium]